MVARAQRLASVNSASNPNGSRLSLPCFDLKYCVMRDISAASSVLSTKVNLTLGGHCYLGSY